MLSSVVKLEFHSPSVLKVRTTFTGTVREVSTTKL